MVCFYTTCELRVVFTFLNDRLRKNKGYVTETTYTQQSLKYFLAGPLWKNCANLSSR